MTTAKDTNEGGGQEPKTKPRTPKKLKDAIENHAVVIFLGAMFCGFVAGLGCYRGVLEITNQETVVKNTYILTKDLQNDSEKKEDEGARTIRHFYALIQGGDFENAWALIHSQRKKQIENAVPNWQAFRQIYATTISHENIKIDVEARSNAEATYWVNFDVLDRLPKSSFYEYRERQVKELFNTGVINRAKALDIVLDDLHTYYDVQAQREPEVENLVEKEDIESLFSPLFVAEIARTLNLPPKLHYESTPKRDVWRHYILNIKLMPDGVDWKIHSGLYPPEAVGLYGPGSKVPSK